MRVNLNQIREADPAWYAAACRASGQTEGEVEIDFDKLKLVKPETQISMADLEAEQQADLKKRSDQARAVARLNEWATAGLDDTQANADLIADFINTSAAKGYYSREIVDVAIQYLGPGKGSNRLTWRKVEAPATPTPEVAEESLVILSDGTTQLPLDISTHDLKKASVAQCKDLLRRSDQRQREHGRFGSKF